MKCKNCGNSFEGKYCNSCGQKVFEPKDKSVKKIIGDAFHFITHFEGSFFNTISAILFRPSKFTTEYTNGIQKKYFKPTSLYLFIVILYLLFPMFQGLNMEMVSYSSLPISGKIINSQITERAEKQEKSIEELAVSFENKSKTTSKVLLLLFIPMTAIFVKLFYFKKKDWYDLFILSTEINIYYLLVFFLIVPFFYSIITLIIGHELMSDEGIGFLFTLLFGAYLSVLFNKYFSSKILVSIIKGILFGLIHTFLILTIYKILVFELTFLLI